VGTGCRRRSTSASAARATVVRVFVLGVDPGVSRCGYAVVERRGSGARVHALGVLTTPPEWPLPQRLAVLQSELSSLFDAYRPQVLAVERVLFQANVRTALSVGQASGLAMVEAARRQVEVAEYSPNQVKDAVVGYGAATKAQVQRMVQTILGLAAPPRPPDAADAAAVALCHLAHAPSARALSRDAAR
jgi:crossover junction endodeoxyribonuclease RuvC